MQDLVKSERPMSTWQKKYVVPLLVGLHLINDGPAMSPTSRERIHGTVTMDKTEQAT